MLFLVEILLPLVQGNININSDSIIVQDNYDPNMPPIPESGEPLVVNVSICLTAIVEINEPKQMITIEAILRFNWTDHRVDAALNEGDALGYALSTKGNTDSLWYPGERPFILCQVLKA